MIKKINKVFDKLAKENEEELSQAYITPIDPEYQFSENGIWALIAPMGAGKTRLYLNLITGQQYLSGGPFFEEAVICSTSGKFDVTLKTFVAKITKTKLTMIKDEDLLSWIDDYLEKESRYDAMMSFIDSEFQKPNEEMTDLIVQNRLYSKYNPRTGAIVLDHEKCIQFLARELGKIGWNSYPHRVLLVLDDFASHPLLKSKEFPLPRTLKKLRHYKVTVVICVQTTMSLVRDIKRICSDYVLFPGIGEEDFNNFIKDSTASKFGRKALWAKYQTIKNDHDLMCIYVKAGKVEIISF